MIGVQQGLDDRFARIGREGRVPRCAGSSQSGQPRAQRGDGGERSGQAQSHAFAIDLDPAFHRFGRCGPATRFAVGQRAHVHGRQEFLFDPARVDAEIAVRRHESWLFEHGLVEFADRWHAGNRQLIQCVAGARQTGRTRRRGDDQFGDHRIELPRNRAALRNAGIEADARSGRHVQPLDDAGERYETKGWTLRVDAELDRMPMRNGGAVFQAGNVGDMRAFGDRQLCGHQIDAGHLFCDGVFDLNTRVDFHERHRAVRIDQKLNGSGAFVVRTGADGDGRVFQRPGGFRG